MRTSRRYSKRSLGLVIRRFGWQLRVALPPDRSPSLGAWPGPATTRRPILVGGTGRSGTTVTAWLIEAHPDYAMIPFEVRFLSDSGGLPDVLAGRTSIGAFERLMMGRWFERGEALGMNQICDRWVIRSAIRELRVGMRSDPFAAGNRFVHRLLDPAAVAAGASGWVEMTPGNVIASKELFELLPDSLLIHCVRDGRDVACSVVGSPWGPTDLDDALDWWATSLDLAYAATSSAPSGRVHTVRLEALLGADREPEYERLREFLELDDHPSMRAFYDASVSADRAHVGRWRSEVPQTRRVAFEAHYDRLASVLAARWGYVREI